MTLKQSILQHSAELRAHDDCVICLAWSPNGIILASASRDNTICLWSQNGIEWDVKRFESGQEEVTTICFLSDNVLLSGGNSVNAFREEKCERLYPAGHIRAFKIEGGAVFHLASWTTENVQQIRKDQKRPTRFYAAGLDGTVSYFELTEQKETLLYKNNTRFMDLDISKDGLLAVCGSASAILLIDTKEGVREWDPKIPFHLYWDSVDESWKKLIGEDNAIRAIEFGRNGLFVANMQGLYHGSLIDSACQVPSECVMEEWTNVIASNDQYLVHAGRDKFFVRDLTTRNLVYDATIGFGTVTAIAVHPSKGLFAVAGHGKMATRHVEIWELVPVSTLKS